MPSFEEVDVKNEDSSSLDNDCDKPKLEFIKEEHS